MLLSFEFYWVHFNLNNRLDWRFPSSFWISGRRKISIRYIWYRGSFSILSFHRSFWLFQKWKMLIFLELLWNANSFFNTVLDNFLSFIHFFNRKSKIEDLSNHFEFQESRKASYFIQKIWCFSLKFSDFLIIGLDCMKSVSCIFFLSNTFHTSMMKIFRSIKISWVIVLNC